MQHWKAQAAAPKILSERTKDAFFFVGTGSTYDYSHALLYVMQRKEEMKQQTDTTKHKQKHCLFLNNCNHVKTCTWNTAVFSVVLKTWVGYCASSCSDNNSKLQIMRVSYVQAEGLPPLPSIHSLRSPHAKQMYSEQREALMSCG